MEENFILQTLLVKYAWSDVFSDFDYALTFSMNGFIRIAILGTVSALNVYCILVNSRMLF